MKPAAFDYVRPASLPEALDALARYGASGKILAGGQSLVPMMNLRVVKPATIIDINRIPDLAQVRRDGHELVIGALARHSDLLASKMVAELCPLMTEAYLHVAHIPIRNRGTLGGNISHADPSSEMPTVLTACDAIIVVASQRGTRTIAARDFFTGPLSTVVTDTEMVTQIRIPVAASGQGWSWQEESNRKGDFAMAGIAATVTIASGKCTQVALAVAGMDKPGVRLNALEATLVGAPLDDARIATAASAAREMVSPGDSYHADIPFKRDLVEALTARALIAARARCA